MKERRMKFDASNPESLEHAERGFTLIEVLVSILITMIVMASVFALLTRGQRSFQREPEVADLQQSARTVLDMVSRDVLQAGAGLPPEFPAFSSVNGGDGAPTDSIEMIGTFQLAGEVYMEPEDVEDFAPGIAIMFANTTNFEIGDIVVVYNDRPVDLGAPVAQWKMASVIGIVENAGDPAFKAQVSLDYDAFDPAFNEPAMGGDIPAAAGFLQPGTFGKMTRVSIVRYFTQLDDPAGYSGPPPQVLMRDVDFAGAPQAVGYLEDFQIQYTIGVTAPVDQDNPPNPIIDLGGGAMNADNMLSGVRISVTARSVTAGMEGASEGGAGRSDDFIRKTFSTNVNPRNISNGVDVRVMTAASLGP